MKKSKFITGLSAAFISAMALMSCSSLIKAKDGVILTIDGVPYTAQDLFNDQKTPAAAEAKFNAVYKVAVRAYFTKDPGKQEMTEITNNTKIKINEQKATAQSNADKNGTSYNEEWQKILDSNGVDDESGLYNKFEYDLQKEKFENNFYEKHYDALRSGTEFPDLPGVEFSNYLEGKQPYHIKHILIKLANAKAGDGVSAEISSLEAHKISTVIRLLAEGDLSFEQISDLWNEDDGAKANHGSLGIMSRDTSFVNDFKLGIYLYESFFTGSTQGTSETYGQTDPKVGLKLTSGTFAGDLAAIIADLDDPSGAIADDHGNLGLGLIPYQEALNLEKYKDIDFTNADVAQRFGEAGLDKDDVAAKYYPRNVIFNKYFNKHNIMVITPNIQPMLTGGVATYVAEGGKKRTGIKDSYYGSFNGGDSSDAYANMKGFDYYKSETAGKVRFAKNDDVLGKIDASNDIFLPDDGSAGSNSYRQVLRDNNGRTVLVFHSGTGDSSSNDAYQGIHFVVIERSPFITYEYDKTKPDGTIDTTYQTSLDEYYTHYWPGQSGGNHPKYNGKDEYKHTFVNYIDDEEQTVLKERTDTVKSELKKCVPNINTYLYQHLLKVGDIKFDETNEIAKGIKTNIEDWIEISRKSQEKKDEKTWNDTWQTYYYSLVSQFEQREENVVGTAPNQTVKSRLVPEICARVFSGEETVESTDLRDMFGKGGVFHE